MAQLFEDNVIDREEFRDMLVQGGDFAYCSRGSRERGTVEE